MRLYFRYTVIHILIVKHCLGIATHRDLHTVRSFRLTAPYRNWPQNILRPLFILETRCSIVCAMTYPDVPRKSTIPEYAKCVFAGVIFDVYQWEQELYDGTKTTFEKLVRPDTVTVYGILPDGKILLTEQEQPGKALFVSPTGGRVDPGEDPLTAAKRELLEESGYEADVWELWMVSVPYTKIAWSIHTFVAKGLRKVSDQSLDGGEKITLKPVPFDTFLDIATHDSFLETDVKLKVFEAKLDPAKMEALKKLFMQ